MRAEGDVGDDLIERHARAEQVPDETAVLCGNADEPGDGPENVSEDLAEAAGNPVETGMEMDPAQEHVEQSHQRQETDEHDRHVEREFAAVDSAACDGADQIFFFVLLALGDDDFAFCCGNFCLRHKHFGHEDGARRGHDDRREQVARLDTLRDVHGHDSAGDVGHAAGHDCHQFAPRGAGQKRSNGQGSFCLAHKNGGGDVHAFCAGDPHGLQHDPGQPTNDDLHEADVVHDREECRDEDDCWQDLKREDGAERGIRCAELPEEYGCACCRGAQHFCDNSARPVHGALSEVEAKDEEGEDELKAQPPGNSSPIDATPVC